MEAFIDQFGYLAVGALILIENVFPPIPSEVILPLSGFLTTTSHLTLPGAIVAATAGSVLGAFILYGIGRVISRERVVGWFETRGQLSVLLCRCVPGVRSLISIPAGTARMGVGRFTLYTLAGSLLWNTVLCGLGAAAGDAWHNVAGSVAWASDVLKLAVVALLVAGACWWVVRRAVPAWREDRA